MSACKVPLVERLRSIPRNLRAEWAMQWDEEGRATGHTLSPVGRLCHEAADRIAELEAEVERLRVQAQRVVDEWDAWLSEAPPEWVSPGMLEAVDALRGEGEE